MDANTDKQSRRDEPPPTRRREIRIVLGAGVRRWLIVVAALLALVAGGLWVRPSSWVQSATAAKSGSPRPATTIRPDSVTQRKEIIEQLRQSNAKLDGILNILAQGQVKVVVVSTEKKGDGGGHESRP